MIIVNPEMVAFENTKDIVDYIGKGIPPTRKQFNRLMERVKNPLPNDTDPKAPENLSKIIIREEDIANWRSSEYVQAEVTKVLEQMYADRIRNRNIAIGVGEIGRAHV